MTRDEDNKFIWNQCHQIKYDVDKALEELDNFKIISTAKRLNNISKLTETIMIKVNQA